MPNKSNSSTPSSSGTKPKAAKPAKPAEKKPASSGPRWVPGLLIGGGIFLFLVAGGATAAFALQSQTILRGVTILGQDVSGLDTLAATTKVEKAWKAWTEKAFTFSADGKTVSIPVVGGGGDENEIVLELAGLDIPKSVDAAYDYGHDGQWYEQVLPRLGGIIGARREVARTTFSTNAVIDLLQDKLKAQEKTPVNAGFSIDENNQATLTPSANGRTFDYLTAVKIAQKRLKTLNATPIPVSILVTQPSIVSSPTLQTIADSGVAPLLTRAPLTLTYEDKKWTIDEAQLRKLLGFTRTGGEIEVGLDEAKVETYLGTIKEEVEVAPQEAKFTIAPDGKVTEFQTSVVGIAIDVPATYAAMQTALKATEATAVLAVKEEKPLSDTVAPNNLGIKELVAEGRTNFRGSPPNRIYNLSLGAQRLHGLMIKPGETFSLIDALGKIDGAHGWKPELVIKEGGRITPEFGGGLCQVATTLFRAALNTGLPIVERVNHSLRISYYEPPIGLDATIYEPKPDLRFKNDYEYHLLLQTKVVGTELVFQFYGTKDGRTVDIPTPKVYNKTGIPATRTIEVSDLPPGKKVCQTPGHPGADATATYTVTKPGQEPVVQVFQSHYKAIGVICRVGKAKAETKEED